jgi:hypothetical protein
MRGLIAGCAAGAVMDLIEYGVYRTYREPVLRSVDWLALIAGRRRPVFPFETLLWYGGHLLSASFLGVSFAAAVPRAAEEKPVLKGCVWAGFVWLLTQVFTKVFYRPVLSRLGWEDRIQHLVLVYLWGSPGGESALDAKILSGK